MTNSESTAYKLYAAFTTAENAEKAAEERFSRITPKYILAYSAKAIDGFTVLEGDNLKELTATDSEWLKDCNTAIMWEYIERHREALQKGQAQFLKEFKDELEKELNKTEG